MSKDDWLASELRGFGAIGLVAIAAIVAANLLLAPLGALLVLAWAWRARIAWSDLGFRRLGRWRAALAVAVLAGILLKFVQKALVMPLLDAPAINPYFHYIAGNPAALAKILVAGAIIGGIGEEIFYRGYAFERLGRLWGHGASAKAVMVALTTLVFALAHLNDQGVAGAQQAAFTGLVFGTIYAATGRLWLSMVVHAVYNITAVLIIYFDLETAVARSILG